MNMIPILPTSCWLTTLFCVAELEYRELERDRITHTSRSPQRSRPMCDVGVSHADE